MHVQMRCKTHRGMISLHGIQMPATPYPNKHRPTTHPNPLPPPQPQPKVYNRPEKSSQDSCTDVPGTYLPKSTTVVTPLIRARLLALTKASLLSSTETSGIQGRRSFIAESISNPLGSVNGNDVNNGMNNILTYFNT